MQAEKLETANLGRRELPQPAWVAAQPRLSVNLDLRQIMVSLVYFAALSLVGREVYRTSSPLSIAGMGVCLGFGLMYFGIWLACRLGRLAMLAWLIFLGGYCAATFSMMGWLTIPTVPVVVGVIIYLNIQNRRNQQNGLLWVLAVASDRGIPLAPGVEAFAQQNQGIFRERCSILAGLLQLGKPLSAAIAWLPRVVPWDAPLLIRVGEQTGRLPQALREAAESRARRRDSLRNVYGRIGYLVAVRRDGRGDRRVHRVFHRPQVRGDLQGLRGQTAARHGRVDPGVAVRGGIQPLRRRWASSAWSPTWPSRSPAGVVRGCRSSAGCSASGTRPCSSGRWPWSSRRTNRCSPPSRSWPANTRRPRSAAA